MEILVGNMKCFHPQVYNDNKVSCGRCQACKTNRINGWVCRLERQARYAESAHFLTLTYGENQCTLTKNKLLTLDYSHVQHFFKSLRNITNADYRRRKKLAKKYKQEFPQKPTKFSYYVAGEYGSIGSRPHYHIILFDAQIEFIHRAWATGNNKRRIPRGHIHTGDTRRGSIRYSLKYISKPSRIPLFEGDDRTPEFSHMSKGIGKNYLTPQMIAWHRADLLNRFYVPCAGGIKMTMPRYYADKIYTVAERMEIAKYLEEKQSDDFYKALLINPDLPHNVLAMIKEIERKSFIPKIHQL